MSRDIDWHVFDKAADITASAVRGAMGSEGSQPATYVGEVFSETTRRSGKPPTRCPRRTRSPGSDRVDSNGHVGRCGLVPAAPPRVPVAEGPPGRLPDPGLRVDAPTDAGVSRRADLRGVHRALPRRRRVGQASRADVLRAWAGLGYNRRAVALHETARAVVREHGGRVPRDVGALTRLPGVGPYTAAAVASIGHGVAVAALDGNVRRVVARAIRGAEPDEVPARDLARDAACG